MTDESEPKPTLVLDSGAGSTRLLAALKGGMIGDRDPVPVMKAEPTLASDFSRAWGVDLGAMMRKALADGRISPDEAPRDSTLSAWIVEAPWAHPIWHSYCIVLVHLREVGLVTKFYLDGATHEFWLYALDPNVDRDAIVRGDLSLGWGWLTPKNYADQMICQDDAAARAIIREVVQDILEGKISPDTDHQSMWIARFGGHMLKPEYR